MNRHRTSPWRRLVPALDWLPVYSRDDASADSVAALVVTIILIPQSLAYAMLAGLPPVSGLYASILPLIAYAVFGSSRTLAVGPVAVVSLLTAAAVGNIAEPGSAEYLTAALVLAAASGLLLVAMGLLRLGWIANYLSHPVMSGFITASGMLIAVSQLEHILGVQAQGENLVELGHDLLIQLDESNLPTLAIGVASIGFMYWARKQLNPLLRRFGAPDALADVMSKAGPVVAVIASIVVVAAGDLEHAGVQIVGSVPQGLPPLTLPSLDPALWRELLPAAVLISLIGFVESISMAQTLAAKRRQRISPDQELTGLGAGNLAAAFSGGFPVTGSFARSIVNFDSGARTPMAGILSAGGIALTVSFLTPLFFYLPQATLAATVIVAVLSLVDVQALRRTWIYSKADFAAMAATIVVVLAVGVEAGVLTGVGVSIALFLWQTSRPHVALVGLVPGTEHFRNVRRHRVVTSPKVLSVRVDESLYFANARYLEDCIYDQVVSESSIEHVILMCTAINHIDASALESLKELVRRLDDAGVKLHLSEVKGPVMDQLKRSDLLAHLSGEVFLSQFQAFSALDPVAAKTGRAALA